MTDILFWVSVILLAYHYLGYPALIAVCAALWPRPVHLRPLEPQVSVVVAAHNEGSRIGRRLENLLSIDYPRDRLEIIVASDGSTDDTVTQAQAYEPRNITVLPFTARRGKAAVLNDAVPKARGEIVILTDTRQLFETDAIRALIAPFADPQVGAVSGELILADNLERTPVGKGVQFYWGYEKSIRRNESLVDSTIGATGAIYAIRRELFEPIPEGTILDDVLIPMRITRRGYRVLFTPDARAHDTAAATASEEFTRKVRTIAGNFHLFAEHPWLLNPFRNRLWLQTVSHKALRLWGPLFLAVAFGANLFLLDRALYRWSLFCQLGFYVLAAAGHMLRGAKVKTPLVTIPYAFCLLNGTAVVALFRFFSGRQQVTWDKASPEGNPVHRDGSHE